MKIRDSGMPDEALWSTFFDPAKILTRLGLTPAADGVVDLGCGYGTFAIPAAKITPHQVYAVDIEPEMIAACRSKAEQAGLVNLVTLQRDFFSEGTGLPEQSVDYCMLFNILHTVQPVKLLQEACRILRPGGKSAIIHWNYDASTPRGPEMSIRPRPQQVVGWLRQAGFSVPHPVIDLPPYHYGIVAEKGVSLNL